MLQLPGSTSSAQQSSTVAAQASSSASASLSSTSSSVVSTATPSSAISSTTVAAATSVAAVALGDQQRAPKTKEGQERKQKDAEYDPLRAERETAQANAARERDAAREREAAQALSATVTSATSVAADALWGREREYKGNDREIEWQKALKLQNPQERQKALENFYAKFRLPSTAVVPQVSSTSATQQEQPKKPSFVKNLTGVRIAPTADLFRSVSERCAKFQRSSSLFSTHPLGQFSVTTGDAFFNRSIIKDIGYCATLINSVQPIETNPGVVTLEASLEGRVEKDTGRSHLLVKCTPTSTTRPPCDIAFITDEPNTLSDVELSLFDELSHFDRAACIKLTPISRGSSYQWDGKLVFRFTQVTEQNKVALRHKVMHLKDNGPALNSVPDIVKGVFSAFEHLNQIDRGAHRARVVVWWQVGRDMPDFGLTALHAHRSSTTPVVYCYPGQGGFKPIQSREYTLFQHLGGCPIMAESVNSIVKLSRLTQFSSPNACQITSSQLEIDRKVANASVSTESQIRDISCMGSAPLNAVVGTKGITLTGLSVGRFCRLNMPFSFGVECDGMPAAVSLQMASENGPWQVTPLNKQLTLKLEIDPTLPLSPFKTYQEGIVRILVDDKSNNYRNKAWHLEELMKQIPTRHLVLVNNIALLVNFIEGYYKVLKTIQTGPQAQKTMEKLEFELNKAIWGAIITEYDWDQLDAHVRITCFFAEELERNERLWKGTSQSLEERLKQGLFPSQQRESALESVGLGSGVRKLVMGYLDDIHTRYAAIGGVKNGLLCSGTIKQAEEAYGKEIAYDIVVNRTTGLETVVETERPLIRFRYESIQFTPYSMRLNLGQLEQQTKWPEVVKQFYREFLNGRDRDARDNLD